MAYGMLKLGYPPSVGEQLASWTEKAGAETYIAEHQENDLKHARLGIDPDINRTCCG